MKFFKIDKAEYNHATLNYAEMLELCMECEAHIQAGKKDLETIFNALIGTWWDLIPFINWGNYTLRTIFTADNVENTCSIVSEVFERKSSKQSGIYSSDDAVSRAYWILSHCVILMKKIHDNYGGCWRNVIDVFVESFDEDAVINDFVKPIKH